MAFGQEERPELCYQCHTPKQGTTIGKVGGVGWCSPAREGLIPACINPDCAIGRQNLERKAQMA